jgi:ADP-heptose:LPS heptosyltransferase
VPLRRWAEDRYIELARRLLDAREDLRIVFTGRPDEAPGAERLARAVASPRCVSLAGRTTLGQLLALYSLSQVLVTNDSGPAHFATLTPIDVVTLFGPETPALFAARTPRNHVLWAGLACSPCVSAFNNRLSDCRDNLCMQRIPVDDVLAETLAALARRLR